MTASHYFLNADRSGRASMVAALIKKLFQKGRDNFFLQSVPVYFPWTGAGENGNASQAAAQRQVHRQAIARNQTTVALHISQMLKQSGRLCNMFTFNPADSSSFFNSS